MAEYKLDLNIYSVTTETTCCIDIRSVVDSDPCNAIPLIGSLRSTKLLPCSTSKYRRTAELNFYPQQLQLKTELPERQSQRYKTKLKIYKRSFISLRLHVKWPYPLYGLFYDCWHKRRKSWTIKHFRKIYEML